MYRRLLDLSLASAEESPADGSVEHLLGAAQAALRRVHRPGRSVEGQVAAELDYDRALVRLCRAVDVPVDLDGFERPAEERRRLERALAERGLSLAVGA